MKPIDFFIFLYKHKCLKEFIINVKSYHNLNSLNDFKLWWKKHVIHHSIDSYITMAFCWHETKEGALYWCTIHKEWRTRIYFNIF